MIKKSSVLVLALLAVSISINAVGAAEPEWKDLFDGKTLHGWIQRNGKADYTVEDGMIVGATVLNTPNSFLCTEKDYRDFILELEYMVDPTMNSGIQIRSNSYPDYNNSRVHGYQVEIDPSPRAWSGGIYDEGRRGWLFPLEDHPEAQKAFKQGQWNHYRIEAIGDRIRTWVNGVPVADLVDDMTGNGFIALQVHNSNKAGQKIKWRNIRIKDLTGINPPQLKALIVDGQNNHDWKATTPVIKEILEAAGIFTVIDVATSPPGGQLMDNFKPNFSKYDVVVSNYTGDEWPQVTKEALVKYMENGGGLVVVHAADNAFPNWIAWNEMIALGGWGGRNEKSGPYVYWKDGKLIRDDSPGGGGAHGRQTDWLVVHRNRDHAITAGLPDEWMHVKDELYSRLRGPAKNMTLLATAKQEPSVGGTGRDEPVMFTVRYGKGRIFHTVLGHAAEQMKCVGFIVTLQRGTEWAATGRVTLLDVPADFPTPEKTSVRSAISMDFSVIEEYDVGKSRAGLAAIEEYIRNVSPTGFGMIETRLLKALASSKTTFAGKQFVCRMLRRVGSAQCVPVLETLLGEEEMSHMARYALQDLTAPESAAAMRRALPKVSDELKIGIVGSLGQRGDRDAVVEIAKLVRSDNQALAAAAISALGRIGGQEAIRVLSYTQVGSELEILCQNSLLMCADQMLKQDRNYEAARIYKKMAEEKNVWIQIAAYKGLIQAEQDRAASYIIALLKSDDLALQRAAGKCIAEISGSAITSALARELDGLDASGQVLLISALETRGDKVAAVSISRMVDHPNTEVRSAALRSLAVLGDASSVPLLAKAAGGQDNTAKIAKASLAQLSGEGITKALITLIQSRSESLTRQAAIQAVIDRRASEVLPVLLKTASDSDPQVRTVSVKAIGELAGPDQVPAMVQLLVVSTISSDRGALERAISSVIARNGSVDPAPILSAMTSANGDITISLLGLLSRIGGTESLTAVRSQLKTNNAEIKRAAIRAMAEWPDPAPLEDLLSLARNETDSVNHVLALRGYINLLGVPANRGSVDTITLLELAMQAARRTDEKRMVLATLPKYPCEEALKMAQEAANEPGLANEAKLAADKIKQALVNRSRKASASLNSDKANLALDNNKSTRWDTGRTMKPGDWFVLDLGIEASVKGLILDTTDSANDFPRGYEVYVSFDGGNWGKPVLIGGDGEPITKIRFEHPIRTRFIKIVQLGSSDSWYWSIHELMVDVE
ncbi:MAG: DUF1080 domain-containing protein [Sedimentisphaerales bacterium]|nr:DUF1080 domain-containing protein [Sedimentisphaerales bacterium]